MLGLRRSNKPAELADATGSRLDSPARISHLLRNVVSSHALLSVDVDGAREPFCSALLEVDRARSHLLIDGPNADFGAIATGTALSVSAQVDGVRLRFESVIEDVGEDERGGYCRLAFPTSVEYEQRRRHHRAPAPADPGVSVILRVGEDEVIEASLRDLSIGGMSLRLTGGEEWTAGRTQVPCTLRLIEQGADVDCEFEVRRLGRQGRITLLAGRFHDLDRRARSVIERCVIELDREHMRKRL